jgi:hypothetical protein
VLAVSGNTPIKQALGWPIASKTLFFFPTTNKKQEKYYLIVSVD